MSDNHLSDLRFDELDLHPDLRAGIKAAGFEFCTPIQASTLPLALKNHDVAGQAQTGTGKTAAFLIAAYQRLLNSPSAEVDGQKHPRVFILAPTRELAVQIANDAEVLNEHTGFKIGLAFGGTDYEKQRNIIGGGIDLLIGTPGRIIDYYKQGVFRLDQVQVAILDEADRMFDLGFIKDIRYLLRKLPEPSKRLNMLFSATLSQRVMELAYEHMNEPDLIRIEPDKMTADRVRQAIFFPSNPEKLPLLVGLIREMGAGRIMVFVNTKREAERIQAYLQANGINASAMQYVINYDLPNDREDYVHRIGRTARAGAAGDAISFGCETYVESLPDIEDYIGHKIPVASYDPALLPKLERPPPRPRKDRGNSRGGKPGRSSGGKRSSRPRR